MSDHHMGGLMAVIIAAPIMIVCCGGGGFILAAIIGGVGGWLSGLGGIATVVAALGALLFVRQFRRYRASLNTDEDADASCCQQMDEHETDSDTARYGQEKQVN